MNQLINTAVAEKIAALLTVDYLAERARRGERAAFERVLAKVPDTEALEGDELDQGETPPNKRLQRTAPRRGV